MLGSAISYANMADDDFNKLKSRLSRYYSAVPSPETCLPLCWNYRDKNNCIGISAKNLRVQYKGLVTGCDDFSLRSYFAGKRSKDAASVRANKSIPVITGAYYFEIRVISKGREGYACSPKIKSRLIVLTSFGRHIGVGISSDVAQLTKLPGWERDSFGYHADDGNIFCGSGIGQPYGPTYSTGDVVGKDEEI